MNCQRNLVIAPIGPGPSHHRRWIRGRRGFDLMLVNYGDPWDRGRSEADFYVRAEGFKLEVLHQAIHARIALVSEYDAVWLPDPDLSISAEEIDALFGIFHDFSLDLAQPAVANDHWSHAITRRDRDCHLRYVNFVEMMCPLFRRELLLEALESFRLNRSGWGVDWYWSKRFRERRLAIIDAVGVFHTRRMQRGGRYYRRLRSLGLSASREMEELIRDHGIDARFVEYGRVPARSAPAGQPGPGLGASLGSALRRLVGA